MKSILLFQYNDSDLENIIWDLALRLGLSARPCFRDLEYHSSSTKFEF